MLTVTYDKNANQVEVDGDRHDYANLRNTVIQVIRSESELSIIVPNPGSTIREVIIRMASPPNRAYFEANILVFSVAKNLSEQFLSFLTFPPESELQSRLVAHHHHFDAVGDDAGTYIAADSLPVVFSLAHG